MKEVINRTHIKHAFTYAAYRQLWQDLVGQGKTTGPEQSEKMIAYTKLNLQRAQRVEKTVMLLPETSQALNALQRPIYWLMLAETWCGDVAQNLPVLSMMADFAPHVELRILLRDEHPEVMNAFLTNGSRSIPKLICLDEETLEVLGTWGPRPKPAQEMVLNYKSLPEPKEPYAEFVKQVQLWYAKDKGVTLQQEFLALLPQWTNRKAA